MLTFSNKLRTFRCDVRALGYLLRSCTLGKRAGSWCRLSDFLQTADALICNVFWQHLLRRRCCFAVDSLDVSQVPSAQVSRRKGCGKDGQVLSRAVLDLRAVPMRHGGLCQVVRSYREKSVRILSILRQSKSSTAQDRGGTQVRDRSCSLSPKTALQGYAEQAEVLRAALHDNGGQFQAWIAPYGGDYILQITAEYI